MKRQLVMNVLGFFCAFFIAAGCGGGSGTSDPGTGSSINDGFEIAALECNGTIVGGTFTGSGGTASVYVQAGEMSSCVGATADPTFTATDTLPSGFDISTSEGDTNVTSGGVGYTFNIEGERGFDTTTEGAVLITLPFDTSAVPAADRTSLKVFVRILSAEDNSVVDVDGTISGGTIQIETRGLPKQFTAAVIYNTNMDEADSSTIDPSISTDNLKTITSLPPWPARKWCVVYNAANAVLIAAVKSVDGIAGTPTAAQIKSAVQTYVANAAANNQTTYESAGFRAPNLFIASNATQVCSGFGTTKRYVMYLKTGSTKFTPEAGEVISPAGNRYGRLFISPEYIANAVTAPLGGIRSIVAHETLHAIQNGYEIFGTTTKGYREGTATVFQMTINNGGTIAVRSANAQETLFLSNYLTADASGGNGRTAYANQDFFAYVGRKYHGGSLAYLSGLFDKMHTDIAAAAAAKTNAAETESFKKQPTRDVLFGAMNSYFQTGLATTGTLKTIYLDFLKQRTFEHNTDSQFGRTGETIIGFASGLFQTSGTGAQNALASVTVNADDCSMGGETGTFGNVAPFAARAIKIITGTTNSDGRKITVTLTPGFGTIGDTFEGYSSWKGVTTAVASSNEFDNFGKTSSDEIDITIANTTTDRMLYVEYAVSCGDSSGGGGGGGGANTFTFTQFTTAETFTPRLALGRDVAIVVGSSSADVNTPPNMIVFFNSDVTGPGAYTLSRSSSPADLMFYTDTIYTYHQTGGTLTFTAFGRNAGDHMTGSFTMTVEDDSPTPRTGTIAATFDFVVGELNAL